MHELSITQSMLEVALEQAKAANASKITRINLTIGELTGVVDDCVKFYFELLSKDTIASQASLIFEKPSTRLRCRNCAREFSPAELDWACPNCHSQSVEIIAGRECYVNSIEVE